MDYSENRKLMVEAQIERRGIKNERVLTVMRELPRHLFVEERYHDSAYADHPLPIGDGQTISQPYIVALMTEKLNLSGNEKVLEIGTGSGYQTAVLAKLSREIYTIERFSSLSFNARNVLAGLGFNNIVFKTGDGSLGWKEFSPFDRILVTAAAPEIPAALFEQLKDNGQMVVPVGPRFSQVLTLVIKDKNGNMVKEEICGCVFVPLVGICGWKGNFDD
ncbi:MAG: protein-L-isoaspartate(D-aspartate) O-methyltransferase [bacterium]